MTGIDLILLGTAAFGFLPLGIILYKRRRTKALLRNGSLARARVYRVYQPVRSATDVVYYHFTTAAGQQATGSLTIKRGHYQNGDVLDVYYHPHHPQRNTVPGAWQSPGLVVFGCIVALAILFAVYKLWEAVKAGEM